MNSFKENLRDELDYQGLTVKELAQKTGLVKGSLDNYLGVRASMPPADVAVKIAQALNVTVEYLVTGADSKTQTNNTMLSNQTQNEIISYFKSISPQMQKAITNLIQTAAKEKSI